MERGIGAIVRLTMAQMGFGLCAMIGSAQSQSLPASTGGTPPPPALGPVVAAPEQMSAESEPDTASQVQPRPEVPKGPERPDRSPVAVLRVLDKVTAETMQFAAPVGRRVRYRSLVFEVKACETWGSGSAEPRPSAYVIIQSDVGGATAAGQQVKQIFKGWIFAQTPSAHVLRHPIYDAWLVSCMATLPVS